MPRGVRAGLVALVLVAGAPAPVAAEGPHTSDPAVQKSRVDRERHRLADRYDETLAAEADQVAAYQQSRAVAAQLASRLVVLDRDVASAQAHLSTATAAAAKALARRDATRLDLRAAQTELTHRRGDLRGMAVAGYVWFGERGGVQTLYGESLTNEQQLLSHFYSAYLDDYEADRIHAVEVEQKRVKKLNHDAEHDQAKADKAREEVAKRRDAVQVARDRQAAAKAAADREVERQRKLVAQVQAQRGEYERQMAELAAESASLGDLLRAHQASTAARTVEPQLVAKPKRTTTSSGPPSSRPVARPTPQPPSTKPPSTRPPSTKPPSSGPTTTTHGPTTTNNAGVGPPPHIPIHLSYPLPGYPVVSGYGWRIHPILGVRKLHEGIDIAAPMGTPIHAAAAGVVIWAGPRNGYGNAVIIDHGSGVGTVYAHQSRVGVTVGQHVSSGQVIGYVGQTGLAASPHCHFEVRVGGHTYDPLAYVRPD